MIDYLINKNKDKFRYERKFVVDQLRLEELLLLIRLHPSMFLEIFYERQVNNIYLDTHNKVCMEDNMIGASQRLKFRVRWYGETYTTAIKPNLELKIKKEHLNTKEIFPLVDFDVSQGMTGKDMLDIFEKSNISESIYNVLRNLEPTLINSYFRRYFQSADKKFRLTIDRNLMYYQVESKNNHSSYNYKNFPHFIIELKYDKDYEEKANNIINHFPFRVMKNSKYVDGLAKLNQHI